MGNEILGCIAKHGQETVGFALWAKDTEDFAFRELPGWGTILEIGLLPSHRSAGLGKGLVAYIEKSFRENRITQCYVSDYGPAKQFWTSCGYAANGAKASNGLTVMVKSL